MGYIIKDSVSFINAKLTDLGRQKLGLGRLNFTYFRVGDSEINYELADIIDYNNFNIFKPTDNSLDIKYPIPADFTNSANTFNAVISLNAFANNITNDLSNKIVRGFFSGTTGEYTKYIPSLFKGIDNNINITGNTNLIKLTTPSIYSAITSGDTIIVKYYDTSGGDTFNGQDYIRLTGSTLTKHLTYKVLGRTGDTVSLDRNLYENMNNCLLYMIPSKETAFNGFYSSGTTIPYWNEATLDFDTTYDLSDIDVKIWNMNIPYSEKIVGANDISYTNYGSVNYLTTKKLFENDKQAIGIIHYTNNTINNFYGEKFYDNSATLFIPNIMWNNKNKNTLSGYVLGETFVCGNELKELRSPIDAKVYAKYYDLVDSTGFIVGKTLPDYKAFIIEDQELLATLSYKSNRNWSYPEPNINLAGVQTSIPLLVDATEQVWITFYLNNTNSGKVSLPSQYYKTISSRVGARDIQINFNSNDWRILNSAMYDAGSNFTILAQKTGINQKPQANQWREIMTFTGNTVDQFYMENTIFTVNGTDYSAASIFNLTPKLNLPTNTTANNLFFGDEVVFFGNVETNIAATSFSSIFTFILDGSKFTKSLNPTFNNSTDIVKISEVLVYDENFEVVAIAKPSSPIERSVDGGLNILQVSIDF